MSIQSAAIQIEIEGGDTATPANLEKRLDIIVGAVGNLEGRRILDCGCGEGDYVRALLERGADAQGIEYNEQKVRARSADPAGVSERIATGDLQDLHFDDGLFDMALLNEVLEHVPDDAKALSEVFRILKPGGMLLVFSPNRLYPFETHGVYLRGSGRRVPHYLPFIPYIPLTLGRRFIDYWARNYWPWQLRSMLRRAGFETTSYGWVWQTFENISGNQPALIRWLRPLLVATSNLCEALPGLRTLAASQLIVCRKPQ